MDYSYSVVFTFLRNQLLIQPNFMLIDMLHQTFGNKIYFENKCKIIIICFIYQSIWMFISCSKSNDDIYYLLIINE